MTAPLVSVANVPIHAVDLPAALDLVDAYIAEGTPHYNVAINAAKVVAYQANPELQDAIREAHLITADGQSVVWAARLLGQELRARVAGADMMEALLSRAAERGHSVYFLGARDAVVEACVAKARALYPTLRIAGARNGYFSATEEASVVAEIRAARPDILFLGFGTPAKEYFMRRRHRELGVPFVMGVGGTFDVFAGHVRRAPQWMQRGGLEWLFRLGQEPRRMWKRYLVGNTKFVALVAREMLSKRMRRRS